MERTKSRYVLRLPKKFYFIKQEKKVFKGFSLTLVCAIALIVVGIVAGGLKGQLSLFASLFRLTQRAHLKKYFLFKSVYYLFSNLCGCLSVFLGWLD